MVDVYEVNRCVDFLRFLRVSKIEKRSRKLSKSISAYGGAVRKLSNTSLPSDSAPDFLKILHQDQGNLIRISKQIGEYFMEKQPKVNIGYIQEFFTVRITNTFIDISRVTIPIRGFSTI